MASGESSSWPGACRFQTLRTRLHTHTRSRQIIPSPSCRARCSLLPLLALPFVCAPAVWQHGRTHTDWRAAPQRFGRSWPSWPAPPVASTVLAAPSAARDRLCSLTVFRLDKITNCPAGAGNRSLRDVDKTRGAQQGGRARRQCAVQGSSFCCLLSRHCCRRGILFYRRPRPCVHCRTALGLRPADSAWSWRARR